MKVDDLDKIGELKIMLTNAYKATLLELYNITYEEAIKKIQKKEYVRYRRMLAVYIYETYKNLPYKFTQGILKIKTHATIINLLTSHDTDLISVKGYEQQYKLFVQTMVLSSDPTYNRTKLEYLKSKIDHYTMEYEILKALMNFTPLTEEKILQPHEQ